MEMPRKRFRKIAVLVTNLALIVPMNAVVSGVAQKYGYISKMISRLFNGHIRGYKRTEIYVQRH
jgi:hypothetical protein